jgi:predicted outer membrane protein
MPSEQIVRPATRRPALPRRLAAFLLVVSSLVLLGPALRLNAGEPPQAKLSRSDRNFLRAAAEQNQAAVELGRVAEQKGFSASARNFARTLVAQRSHAQQELMTVARRLRLPLRFTLNRQDRKTEKLMRKNAGARLDRIFLLHMAADLDRQYGAYEDTAMRTRNPEIRRYIASLLSQVKRQDQVANAMAPGERSNSESPQ